MKKYLKLWITTPSRTASTYLQEIIEQNYHIGEIYKTHIAHECPPDPENWNRIINVRHDKHAATMSMLIYHMEKPSKISLDEYLKALHAHYNYIIELPECPWNSSHIIYMEDFVKNPSDLENKFPHEWPKLHMQWQITNHENFLSTRKLKDWCSNWSELFEIGQMVAKDGHYKGYQIVKDTKDPRFSNKRRPNIFW